MCVKLFLFPFAFCYIALHTRLLVLATVDVSQVNGGKQQSSCRKKVEKLKFTYIDAIIPSVRRQNTITETLDLLTEDAIVVI